MEITIYSKHVGTDLEVEVRKIKDTFPYALISDESKACVLVDLNEIDELIRSLHEAKKVMKENMR